MSARAIGSGTVSFGLVSIPVKVYSTTESSSAVRFNMVNRDTGARVKQQYVDATTGEVVPRTQMARGYEFSKGQYVVLSDEEYKALQEVATNSIELTEFVPVDRVDPLFYEKAYFLGPDKGGARAYRLLAEAMERTGLVGLAKYAARGKQYLVMVRPHGGSGLVMHQLHYVDELKSFDEVPIEDVPPASEAEVDLAVQIIEQIASRQFAPEAYRDEVKARMLELIEQKVAGQEITSAPEAAPEAQVIDLMEALKQSLGETQAAKPAKRAPAKKGASAKGGAKSAKAKASGSKKKTG